MLQIPQNQDHNEMSSASESHSVNSNRRKYKAKKKVVELSDRITMLQDEEMRTENFLKKFILRDFRSQIKDTYKYLWELKKIANTP